MLFASLFDCENGDYALGRASEHDRIACEPSFVLSEGGTVVYQGETREGHSIASRRMKGVRVKRTALVLVAAAAMLVLSPRIGAAQVFYQYPDAAITKAGEFVVGSYAGAGDDELFRLGGLARMNATKYFDVGFELLLDSADGYGRFGAAGDLKFALFPPTNAIPFDLSVTAGIGSIMSDAADIIQIPVGAIISSPFRLNDSGNLVVPYLGVYVVYADTDVEQGHHADFSNDDFDAELRGGASYTLSSGQSIFVGIHLGRDALVTLGATFWLKRQG